ncbi:hypothetical protein DPEC_G00368250 [Dallia pectoralis]|nr:hypothetical protein DPEC_G00368250 [Dallia pectoralis]
MDIKPVRRPLLTRSRTSSAAPVSAAAKSPPLYHRRLPPLTEKDDLNPGPPKVSPALTPLPFSVHPRLIHDLYGGSGGSYNSRKERDAYKAREAVELHLRGALSVRP